MRDLTLPKNRRKLFIEIGMRRCRPGSGSSREFLQKRTWKRPVTNLKSLIRQTPFVVVGGVATRLYMPERATPNLDILVLNRDATKIYRQLEETGSIKIGKLKISGKSLQLPDNTYLSVIESQEAWVEEAVNNPNIAPDGLPIIGLPYLILMKMKASRSIDMGDLGRMLGGADDKALEKIRKAIKTYLPDAIEDLESLIYLGKLEFS
ncbi:MAG: hypothetical protein SXA11_21035 [Cyanobacteriota bacterium]|nr:hypothetical protein [Cyanobacteriota bacterium]